MKAQKAQKAQRSERLRVYVCDPEHPHHGERGVMTGKLINLFGTVMAEVELSDCKHGTGGCFVRKGQVAADARRRDETA
jgi:hypothetical protein